jgi:hypothetical protein
MASLKKKLTVYPFQTRQIKCNRSYVTTCDSALDVHEDQHVEHRYQSALIDLMIKSENFNASEPMVCVDLIEFYERFCKVDSLTLTAKISAFKKASPKYIDLDIRLTRRGRQMCDGFLKKKSG